MGTHVPLAIGRTGVWGRSPRRPAAGAAPEEIADSSVDFVHFHLNGRREFVPEVLDNYFFSPGRRWVHLPMYVYRYSRYLVGSFSLYVDL